MVLCFVGDQIICCHVGLIVLTSSPWMLLSCTVASSLLEEPATVCGILRASQNLLLGDSQTSQHGPRDSSSFPTTVPNRAVRKFPKMPSCRARFEVLTAVVMNVAVFWAIAQCSPCVIRRFGGTYHLHVAACWFLAVLFSTLKMEVIRQPHKSVIPNTDLSLLTDLLFLIQIFHF
jgi:hypothetical protein